MPRKRSTAEIVRMLENEPSASERQQLILQLAACRNLLAQGAIIDALGDTDAGVRLNAASVLGGFPGRKTIDALLKVLEKDNEPQVRELAALSLRHVAQRTDLGSLERAFMSEEDGDTREALFEAIAQRDRDAARRLTQNLSQDYGHPELVAEELLRQLRKGS